LLAEFAQGATADLQGGSARFHAFDIEDVVDKTDQTVGIRGRDAEQVQGFGVYIAYDTGREQAERAADAGERCTQLVRDGGDELILEIVELGPFRKLKMVLVLLFSGLGKLGGQISSISLRSEERVQERANNDQENKASDNENNVHL